MKLNTLILTTAISTLLTLGTLPSLYAADNTKSDYADQIDHEIQNKLDTLMKSEQGLKNAKVRIEVTPKNEKKSKNTLNLSDFDINKDGILDRDEIGEKLFTLFDRDRNHVIDNREMKKVGILAFTPMKKKTISVINYHGEGIPSKTDVTEEEFMQASRLSRFDQDADGLTPLDFLGIPFNKVNVKRDGVIDMQEWKRAYASSVRPKHEEQFNYND